MERVTIERKVLSENDRVAADLRERFRLHGIKVLNLISSPGAGKTALLERALESVPEGTSVAVITGDIQTENDARRLARYGMPVKQITTGGTCHLDARMVEKAIRDWELSTLHVLLIENVGNLVCPTSYDLGEEAKIVVLSTAEGDDKPLKYPGIFSKAALIVLNKLDLLPYVPFSVPAVRENINDVNPGVDIIETSCTSGAGLDEWRTWLFARTQ